MTVSTAEQIARTEFRRKPGMLLVGFLWDGARVVEFHERGVAPPDLLYRYRSVTLTSNSEVTREDAIQRMAATDRRRDARDRLRADGPWAENVSRETIGSETGG